MTPARQDLLTLSPYLLTAGGLLLSFHFRRGRICLLLLLTAISYYLMTTYLAGAVDTPQAYAGDQALAVLLPLNLLLVVLMREKGIFSSAGRMRFVSFWACRSSCSGLPSRNRARPSGLG